MYACVILYRTDTGVFVIGDPTLSRHAAEFGSRDEAIAFAEKEFSADIPYQVVELDEL